MMTNRKVSTSILEVAIVLFCSCSNGANQAVAQSQMESRDSFVELANALMDSTSSFNTVFEKASRFYDIAIEMSRDKDSKRHRLLAQVLIANTIWDVLEKGSGESESDERIGLLIEKAGLFANQWIYEEHDNEAHLFHDTYFMSYKETEYESEDSFTIEVLFPRNESEGYVVALNLPESAVSPLAVLFTKENDGREDRESSVIAEWKDVIPKKDNDLPMTVLSDNELLDLMRQFDYMYFFFETERETADGEHMDSGRISLKPFKDKFNKIMYKR